MSLFLLTALLVYTAMHLVIYWGIRPLLTRHPLVPSLTMAFFALMVAAPASVRMLEHGGHHELARWAARVGYPWMGFALMAFCSFALVGALHLAARLFSRRYPRAARLDVHGAFTSALVVLVVAAVGLYGMAEAKNPRIERVRLTTPKLPPGSPPVRIAQISDLHLGLLLGAETLAPVAAQLAELTPDLIVATGDVVDAQLEALDGLSHLLAALEPPLGKYAILGNHEMYVGEEKSVEFLTQGGFRVLRNETVPVGGRIALTGLDDPGRSTKPDPTPALNEAAALGKYVVLARHRPEVDDATRGRFDLQLSGHTHGGQIFPFHFFVRQRFPYFSGLYALDGGATLYVSRGTGQWGPPMRVLAPSEITLIEIAPATAGERRP